MGWIYKRSWRNKKTGEIVQGDIFWIKYYGEDGKAYYESTHSDKKTKAQNLLKEREGEISKGEIPGIHFGKIRFDELAKDFLTDYRINEKKTLRDALRNVEQLGKTFGGMKVIRITTEKIQEYVDERMEQGLSHASINRELSALKRMFHLGAQCTPPKVRQIPHIPMLKESNTRKGFFEYEEYSVLKNKLPDYLKPIVTFAYHSAWRKAEILGLTWDRVDLKERAIRLDPGETKNEEGRNFYMGEELFDEMHNLHSNRHLGCPYVFHREGKPIKGFKKAWNRACIEAGLFKILIVKDNEGNEKVVKVPTKIFHDFRRTGVRNMIRGGVPERVAMKVSGHKTRSVFDRYNIVSDEDLKEAARKQQAYIDSQAHGDSLVTVEPKVVSFRRKANR